MGGGQILSVLDFRISIPPLEIMTTPLRASARPDLTMAYKGGIWKIFDTLT